MLTIGAIGIVTQFTLGWQHSITLAQALHRDSPSNYAPIHSNLTVSGAVLRMAKLMGFEPYWVSISQVCLAILTALLVWFMWRLRASVHWKLEWSLVSIAMIMLLPHNQPHYLIFLLLPYAVLLDEVMTRLRRTDWRWILLLAVSWGLTAWPVPLSLVHRVFGMTIEQLFWLPLMLWGMALLAWMVITRLHESIAPRTVMAMSAAGER